MKSATPNLNKTQVSQSPKTRPLHLRWRAQSRQQVNNPPLRLSLLLPQKPHYQQPPDLILIITSLVHTSHHITAKLAWVRPKHPRRAPVDIYQDPTEPLRNVLHYFSCQPNAAAGSGAGPAAAAGGERYKILQRHGGSRSPERAPSKTKTPRPRSRSENHDAGRRHHPHDARDGHGRGDRPDRDWGNYGDGGDADEGEEEEGYDDGRHGDTYGHGYAHERPRRIEQQPHGRRHQHHPSPPQPTRRAFSSSEVRPRYAPASARPPYAASVQRRALSSRWGEATTALAI